MRSRFMILFQPSLKDLPFIFPQQLPYKPPSPSFQDIKKTHLFSSLLLSSSEVEESCHILVFLIVATLGIFFRVFLNKHKLHNLIKRKFYILTTTTILYIVSWVCAFLIKYLSIMLAKE